MVLLLLLFLLVVDCSRTRLKTSSNLNNNKQTKKQKQAIIAGVKARNEPPIPDDRVLGLRDRAAADAYLLAHPDGALGAVHFSRGAGGALQYVVQSNSTTKYFKGTFQDPNQFFQLPLISAVSREAAHLLLERSGGSAGGNATAPAWAPALAAFPHPGLDTVNLLAGVLAAFIFASLMFGFVAQVSVFVFVLFYVVLLFFCFVLFCCFSVL